MLKFVKMQC